MSNIKEIIVNHLQKDLDQRGLIDVVAVARKIQFNFPDQPIRDLSNLVFKAVVEKSGNAYFNPKD